MRRLIRRIEMKAGFLMCSAGYSLEEYVKSEPDVAHKIAAVGWGLFLIWIGAAFLTELDPGIGLLGVGVITLGGQSARKHFKLKLEGFWVVIGLVFVVAGLCARFGVQLPMIPIALFVAGGALLVSALRRGKKPDKQ